MSLFSITGLLPAFLVTLIALISARFLVKDTSATDNHEFVSIDGLRGYLALFVFLHHSVYWFNFSHLNGWNGSNSMLFNNFGQTSICLFFMLSGFLFCNKLLIGRTSEIDWLKIFCSRFLRLAPLYLSLVAVMLIIIALESGLAQFEDTSTLRSNIFSWLLFTAPGHPDINAHADTHLMVAGVIWTLPYEWFFYFSLPALGLLLGTKSKANSGIWLMLSVAIILSISSWHFELELLWGFLGGGIAAFVARNPGLRQLHQGRGVNWIVLAGLIIAYSVFDKDYTYTRLLILTATMCFIACGANLFGLLDNRAARALSTVSYGIYLLHGLVLYLVLNYVLSAPFRQSLSAPQYWLVMFICTPVIVSISALSWHWIEWPAIKSVSKLTRFLRNLHTGNTPVSVPNQIVETTGEEKSHG